MAPLTALIDARIFDLYDDPMPSLRDLEGYAGETVGAVIRLSPEARVFVGERHLATLTTVRPDGTLHVVPVAFKDVTDDGKTLEGYQIRGAAEHVSDGPVVAMFKAMVEQMFQGAATAKGVLVITPETVIVTTPGAENKKVL